MTAIWYCVAAVFMIVGGWKSFMNFLELRNIPAGPRTALETVTVSQLRHRKRELVVYRLCRWGFLLAAGLGILIWKIVAG